MTYGNIDRPKRAVLPTSEEGCEDGPFRRSRLSLRSIPFLSAIK